MMKYIQAKWALTGDKISAASRLTVADLLVSWWSNLWLSKLGMTNYIKNYFFFSKWTQQMQIKKKQISHLKQHMKYYLCLCTYISRPFSKLTKDGLQLNLPLFRHGQWLCSLVTINLCLSIITMALYKFLDYHFNKSQRNRTWVEQKTILKGRYKTEEE